MSKKLYTAETKIKPGSDKNLSVAAFGDHAGVEYDRARLLVSGLLHLKDTEDTLCELPEMADMRAANRRMILQISLEFVTSAILNNRPEDLRKLADVVERTHRAREVDQAGEIRYRAASQDIYQVVAYRFLKLESDPDYRFTKAEITAKVADAQGIKEIDRKANDSLRKRVEAIIKITGLPMRYKSGK